MKEYVFLRDIKPYKQGDKASLEPLRGHHQEQEMVDCRYADPYVRSYAAASVPPS